MATVTPMTSRPIRIIGRQSAEVTPMGHDTPVPTKASWSDQGLLRVLDLRGSLLLRQACCGHRKALQFRIERGEVDGLIVLVGSVVVLEESKGVSK